jgi:mRNA interferase HicA
LHGKVNCAFRNAESRNPPRRIRKADIDAVITFDYHEDVKASELKRKLAKAGCTFTEGTNHLVIHYKDNRSLMPRHPAKEIKTGTLRSILKELGIKEL